MMLEPGFWDDQQGAQVIINEGNGLKAIVNEYKELEETHENLDMTLELLREEPDEELQEELGKSWWNSNKKWLILSCNYY